jgi:hypothetical protein
MIQLKMNGFASPDGDKGYFFSGASYVRYDVAAGRVDDGYPLRIGDNWPGLFADGLDACVPWNDGTVLFFKGDQYVRYDWAADRVADGYPRLISDDWPGLFGAGIDAGVLLPSGNAYFFQGGSYVTWDTAAGAVTGDPQSITDGWSGLFDAGIEAAVQWPDGELYFFRGGDYSRYDVNADAVAEGYPRSVADDWAGLPFDEAAPPAPPVPVPGDGVPARQLSVDEAFAELDQLMASGLLLHARSQMAGKVDLDGWDPSTAQKQDGNVAGVVVRYLPSGSKNIGSPSGPNAPDRLDPRNAVAIVRLCQWLAATFGVTELYHLGIDGDGSGQRTDCHGQGRAVDFVGVKGVRDGAEYVLTVNDDWGTVDTPSTPGGIWQPVGTSTTHFRLDDAPGREFERDFFRAVYEFITTQWQDKSAGPDGAAAPGTIGAGSFVMNPDHPTSKPGTKNGREAHQNHIHMQIGVTGTA